MGTPMQSFHSPAQQNLWASPLLGKPLFMQKNRAGFGARPYDSMESAAASTAAALFIHMQLRQLAVRTGHKLFELILKAHGPLGLRRCCLEAAHARSAAGTALPTVLTPMPRRPGVGTALRTGRRRD